MQSDNRFLDDLVKLVNGAAGTFAGMGREAEAGARAKAREWIGGLDFVSRDEFEAVKAMAAAARDEADALRRRLDALDGRSAAASDTSAPTTETVGSEGPHVAAGASDADKAEAAGIGVDFPK